ncbi:hypothetical protein X943_003829 [Babesia divergens]|uniref:Pre-rRNA-processing protein TSR2 n=1 Tax=Babesia divergens TaxID=32595 RepID=A0AAD9G7W8_BABDI|nr:hypothetical protein X943_003829 [Babesia divergens]
MFTAVETFGRACRTVLSCWTALNLAVENGWGGDSSVQKCEDLIKLVIDFCLSKKQLYTDEVEDLLLDQMQTLFFVEIEDGSEVEIARLLVQLHNTCNTGDWSFAQELCQKLTKCDSSQCRLKDNVVVVNSDDSDSAIDIDHVDSNIAAVQGERRRQPKTEELDDGWTKIL